MLYEEFYFKIIFCCCYFNSNKVKLIKVYLVFDFFQNRKKKKRYLLDTSSSSSVLVCYKLQLNIVHSERERERGENDGRNADCRNVRWRMAQGEIGATWRRCFVVRKWIWVKNFWWTFNILLNFISQKTIFIVGI